jgi:hypothetical protein
MYRSALAADPAGGTAGSGGPERAVPSLSPDEAAVLALLTIRGPFTSTGLPSVLRSGWRGSRPRCSVSPPRLY